MWSVKGLEIPCDPIYGFPLGTVTRILTCCKNNTERRVLHVLGMLVIL